MRHAAPLRPDDSEYARDFARYIRLVPDCDLLEFLADQLGELQALFGALDESRALELHSPYTWTSKQVVGHITDTERVFGYRALRLARHDPTPLPSFDEGLFMQHVDFNAWPIGDLVEEFALVRRSHLHLFRRFAPPSWTWRGVVNGHAATARALAFAIAGHAKHHLDIVRKRLAM